MSILELEIDKSRSTLFEIEIEIDKRINFVGGAPPKAIT
jgi:hypothetical protein